MQDLLEEKKQDSLSPSFGAKLNVVFKFLLFWFLSLLILVFLAFLSNIEWARPQVERALFNSFHRVVSLGELSWSLGIQGLAINTNSFEMKDRDGTNFVKSGPAEIGIAFLPLIEKKLVIKHLKFKQPEIWARKLSSNTWNFSDLLTEGPEIHEVQLERGKLHLRNKSKGNDKWAGYDLSDIKLNLTLPHGRRHWPLLFSCSVLSNSLQLGKDESKLNSNLTLMLTGQGPYSEWKKHKYSVNAQFEKLNFNALEPLLNEFVQVPATLPPLKGLSNLSFKGEGIYEKEFLAHIALKTDSLKLRTDSLNLSDSKNIDVEFKNANASTQLSISPKNLKWKNFSIHLSDWDFDSNGNIENWQSDKLRYEAKIGGKFSHLKEFFSQVISKFIPAKSSTHSDFANGKLAQACQNQQDGKLCGTAVVELQLNGDKVKHNISTKIKVNDVPLSHLLEMGGQDNFLESFKFDPAAPIKGEITIEHGKRLDLKDVEIPLEKGQIILSGSLDQENNNAEISFKTKNLSFEIIKKCLGNNHEFFQKICIVDSKTKSKIPLTLDGKLDLNGKFFKTATQAKLQFDCVLDKVKISRQDNRALLFNNICGNVQLNNGTVYLKKLSGQIANLSSEAKLAKNNFVLDGYIIAAPKSLYDLKVNASEFNLAALKECLKAFEINFPASVLDKASGVCHELILKTNNLNGSSYIEASLKPDQLTLNLSTLSAKNNDATKTISLNSGIISYADNKLTVKDLNILGRNGKLNLSAELNGSLADLKLNSARIKTDGFELTELQGIVNNKLVQGKTEASLPKMLLPKSFSTLHGKIYGELQILAEKGGFNSEGVLGFHNLGGKFASTGVNVDKLSGLIVVGKSQLVIQDTSGQIGRSNFLLDGTVNNYCTDAYQWQGQLKGKFYPSELAAIVANLGHGISIDSRAQDALFLTITGEGNKNSSKVHFSGKANSDYGLVLKSNVLSLCQPKDKDLEFKGTLLIDEQNQLIELSKLKIDCADEFIMSSGQFKWDSENAEKPAFISFAVNTPDKIRAATLLNIIQGNNSNGNLSGRTQLTLKLEGPSNDLVLSGSITLDKLAVPTSRIDNFSGKIEFPHWHLNQNNLLSDSTLAKFKLNAFEFGGLSLHDAAASILLDKNNPSRILLRDFRADFSGGRINLDGYFDTQTQNYHSEINISKLVVDQFVTDLIDHSGGVTGLADIYLSIDSHGEDTSSYLENVKGSGKFNIYQGSVASFGKLEEKLQGANLLQQGILGFNVNNLVQTMLPVKTGQFKEISGQLGISKGVVSFDQLRFEGTNLRMRAVGDLNLLTKQINMDVAGDIPRVSSSIIPGPLGEMSRKLTLQNLFKLATFQKLKDLPALPLLGDIANDDPRAFSFKVSASTDSPKLITQSVEKSFKWLPNKPFASAHPVPGM